MVPSVIPYRYYQSDLDAAIQAAWEQGHRNVLAVLPTGGGKTVLFSGQLARMLRRPSVAIAHRQELVEQMSRTLNRYGVPHRVIAPNAAIRQICAQHVKDTGRTHYDPNAPCAVAGVDTLLNRAGQLVHWLPLVQLWVIDEAHHLLESNKWGKACAMFPNAMGLGVTATPCRASGEGLGRHAQGLFDVMAEGPTMRQMINGGWLTDYRIYAPPSDLDLHSVAVSKATGDYNPQQLKGAVRKSHIIGDVVDHYQRIAPGKLAVCFASDVETATDIAQSFRDAGVRAEVVSAKTPSAERSELLARFSRREIDVLVNVDLFGEGFDLPAIEVVIMARPTQSFALYCQQFGRALRLMVDVPMPDGRGDGHIRKAIISASRKPRAIIIDHVGNVVRHGLPDAPREWTLDARERRGRSKPSDVIPLTSCLNVTCMAVYERIYPECPFCGHKPTPAARNAPEFVDGDLFELDAETLAAMRAEVDIVDQTPEAYAAELAAKRVPQIGIMANLKRHRLRQDAQEALRGSMAWWAAHHRDQGRGDREIHRRFWFAFGMTVLQAKALNTDDARALAERVNISMMEMIG